MRKPEIVYTDVVFAANQEKRARKLLQLAFTIISLSSVIWTAFNGYRLGFTLSVIIQAFFSAACVFALLRGKHIPLRPLVHALFWLGFIYIWYVQLVFEGLTAPHLSSVHAWFMVLATATFLLLLRERRLILGSYITLALLSFVVCQFALIRSDSVLPTDVDGAGLARGVTLVSVFVTLILLTWSWVIEVRDAERNLTAANDRLEELLENMLPRSISERLRREGRTFADGVAECSVLFVDIVGFTKLSSAMPAEELVQLLDEIFSRFDELTGSMGLEKIKTIGDAYMVASGLLQAKPDHAQALVRLALKMRAIIREYDLHIRSGINSGSVVAGVIGKKRFIYDLWGDTVNVASRMESQGVVDEIQVTQTTADLIRGEFALSARRTINIKGKGEMAVYLVMSE